MDGLTSAIVGGFISKIISDITDVSDIKNKIINAVKNKRINIKILNLRFII